MSDAQRDLELEQARAAFERFNQTNDPGALKGLESSELPVVPSPRPA